MEINTPHKLFMLLRVKDLCLRAMLPQHLQRRIGIASSMSFDRLMCLVGSFSVVDAILTECSYKIVSCD